MKKSLIVLSVSAVVLGSLLVYPTGASAYRGDPTVLGPNCTQERHDAVENAIETNNYDAWKNLMQGRGRVTQIITKDNFAQFAKAYKLAEEGNYAEAAKIRQELGLGTGYGMGSGMGMGRWNR